MLLTFSMGLSIRSSVCIFIKCITSLCNLSEKAQIISPKFMEIKSYDMKPCRERTRFAVIVSSALLAKLGVGVGVKHFRFVEIGESSEASGIV